MSGIEGGVTVGGSDAWRNNIRIEKFEEGVDKEKGNPSRYASFTGAAQDALVGYLLCGTDGK